MIGFLKMNELDGLKAFIAMFYPNHEWGGAHICECSNCWCKRSRDKRVKELRELMVKPDYTGLFIIDDIKVKP